MITILLHTPELYKEIMAVIRRFTRVEYQDEAELIDYYAQQFILTEIRRRQFPISDNQARTMVYCQIWEHPLVTDYLINHSVIHHMVDEPKVWQAVEEEVTFSVAGEPWMWSLGAGVWKILTLGYVPCQNNTSLSTTTNSTPAH
jgi:hypothetical protein